MSKTTILNKQGADAKKVYQGYEGRLRVIVIGDSITQYGSASGWMLYVEMASNGAVKLVKDAAVAGQKTYEMWPRFATDVAPYADKADELWIMAGANDVSDGRTSAQFAGDLQKLIRMGLDVGLRVRVFVMPPNDTNINNALKFREVTTAAAMAEGVDCFDPWQDCINPATGGFVSADTVDGVHPSAAGHTKAGQAIVAALNIPTTHRIALPILNAANGGDDFQSTVFDRHQRGWSCRWMGLRGLGCFYARCIHTWQ